MPASRCAVQDCHNKYNPKEQISLHNSPQNKILCAKWKKFVSLHERNLSPEGRFIICTKHFEDSCFSKTLHVQGSLRRLIQGSVLHVLTQRHSPFARHIYTHLGVSYCNRGRTGSFQSNNFIFLYNDIYINEDQKQDVDMTRTS